MTKKELYDWFYENFDFVVDKSNPAQTYLDLIPKTDVAQHLDDTFRPTNHDGFYLTNNLNERNTEIYEFLMKFYNTPSRNINLVLRDIYYQEIGK